MPRRRAAWEAFQSGHEPTGISDQVVASWRRSRWSGVDPVDAVVPVVGIDVDTPFVRLAVPILLRTAQLLTDTPASLALTDARGRVVWHWVCRAAAGTALAAAPMRGHAFREESVGTNAIGTALESRGLVEVVGAEHYVEAFHRWACVAAPVLHPVTRRLAGVVDVTCFAEDADQFLRALTASLADAVAGQLLESASATERTMLDAFTLARARTTAPIVVVGPTTMIVDDAAGRWGLDHPTLRDAARGAAPDADLVLRPELGARVHPLDTVDAALLTLHPRPHLTGRTPLDVAGPRPLDATGLRPLEVAEAEVIAGLLTECRGNKSAVAARLQISRATLYQKLRRYRLDAPGRIPLPSTFSSPSAPPGDPEEIV